MKEGFVEVDGVKLHYAEAGTGPAVVFVHGWGCDLHSWDEQIQFLQDRFRVIAYDWRGHGRSGLTPRYPFAALGRELEGVLTALNVTRPVLCGHSMGGTIVMEYATSYSRPLAGLMLVDTNIPGNWLDHLHHWVRCYGAVVATEGLAPVFGSHRALEMVSEIYGRVFWSEAWRKANPEKLAAWQERFADGLRLGMTRAYLASACRRDPTPGLRTLSLPTLVVVGTDDQVFPVTMARQIASAIRGSTLALIEGAGHMSLCEQPDRVNAFIDTFLRPIAADQARL